MSPHEDIDRQISTRQDRNAMLRTLLLLLLISFTTLAQAVYRCESNGEISYRDRPCPGGKIMSLQESLRNIPPQAQAAAKARMEAEARRLAAEHAKREEKQEIQQRQLLYLDAVNERKCVELALRKRWADEERTVGLSITDRSGQAEYRAASLAGYLTERYYTECGIGR
jgi:DNA-binding transcriptional MocR family regulator